MSPGYRESQEPCAACGVRPRAPDALGFCSQCLGGDLDEAAAKWGFEVRREELRLPTPSPAFSQIVEIKRPTRYDCLARIEQAPEGFFGAMRRVFSGGREGLDRATASFERHVRVMPDDASVESPHYVVELEPINEALLDLVCLGCSVELYSQSVWSRAESHSMPPVFPDEDEVFVRVFAIAVAIERLGRAGAVAPGV